MIRRPPRSPLFPSTPLFRSLVAAGGQVPARHPPVNETVDAALARHGSVADPAQYWWRSEEHTSELQSRLHLVCRLLLEKKKKKRQQHRRSKYSRVLNSTETQ